MCLAQGPQLSDAGEAGTCGISVSSQALYHCAPYKAYDKCHHILNPFKSNETSHFYQSIFVFRVVGCCFLILFKFKKNIL